ncbi:MAG: ATP-binding protein [Planctomycetes bacterium]|nr:ATP-binding protein [Planctomycetota bacterium]
MARPKRALRVRSALPRLRRRIVLTGGPAAGKTAILEVVRRHLAGEVQALPESASLLFKAGFPRPRRPAGVRCVQQAIFAVQRQLENCYALMHPNEIHVCDRGSLDGAAFWPGGTERFVAAMGTTLDDEYHRYDAVLFLETSAYHEAAYPKPNGIRIENAAQARRVDRALQQVWGAHPGFHRIGHKRDFYEKVAEVLIALYRILGRPPHRALRRRGVR